MNKMVEYYISELLFLHDCVIIPNFGGFVGNPKSAKLNKITGVLSPPSKQILFNANLKTNDGLLITHISKLLGTIILPLCQLNHRHRQIQEDHAN